PVQFPDTTAEKRVRAERPGPTHPVIPGLTPRLAGYTKRPRPRGHLCAGARKTIFTAGGVWPLRTHKRPLAPCRLCTPPIVSALHPPISGRSPDPVYRGPTE